MSFFTIRLRLTVVYGAAMAVVLAMAGFLLYDHLASSLDATLDQGLRARAADVAALVRQADTGLREARQFAGASNGFAQVLDMNGHIFDASPGLDRAPLLRSADQARARRATLLIPRTSLGGESVRLLAVPAVAQDQHLIVVVGATLETRDEALARLRIELFVGGPAALLLASLIGYLVAAGALRPVERMRLRAAAISARRLSERLPVSGSGDEVARLGETLNQMLARLEAALKRERSFVADASHELRTPLALLRAEVELAIDRPRSRTELKAALESVGEETERLSQLADALLLLARLDEGVLPIHAEPGSLDDLLHEIVARVERRLGAAGRTIEVEGHGLRIWADRARLQQALSNLVENGLRYGAGPIQLFAVDQGTSIELHVTDCGPGFQADFLPVAFERFTRPQETRSQPGAGLGLAIVAAVAKAHGGTVAAANRPEGGADVWLSLPSVTAAEPSVPVRPRGLVSQDL
jgi:signal transduction histidine kinase